MLAGVQVKDYYENDANGLWSWYLKNLRNGEFEELIGNKLRHGLFKRFLRKQFLGASPLNRTLLFVSIPDNIHEDIPVLEDCLSEYLHLKDAHSNIVIEKLTTGTVYNHENHYLVQDNVTNFNDQWFLDMKKDITIANRSNQQDTDDSTESCRQIMKESYPCRDDESLDTYSMVNSDNLDAESESIVLNFKHPQLHPGPTITEAFAHPTMHSAPQSIVRTSPNSESSLMTNGEDLESYRGEDLVQTMTRTVDEDEDEYYEYPSHTQVENRTHDSESIDDLRSKDVSIPPSISISDSFGSFRLVLQSIVITNLESDQIFTGIRQSENDRSNADVNDDWLLYDSTFDLSNLQMLSLYDILDFSKFLPKILFYSMIQLKDSTNNSNTVNKSQIKENELTNMYASPKTDDGDATSELSSTYSYTGNQDAATAEPVLALYSPKTAATEGHRSIRTIESIGAWALNRSNTKKTMETMHNTISRDSKGALMNKIKSQPMPELLKTLTSSLDQEAIKMKRTLAKAKARRAKNSATKSCVIM